MSRKRLALGSFLNLILGLDLRSAIIFPPRGPRLRLHQHFSQPNLRAQIGYSIVLVALVASLPGCGGRGGEGVDVQGVVTLNGEALPNGLVYFLPGESVGQKTVTARVVDGEFHVKPDSQLAPGTYRIAITSERETGRMVSTREGGEERVAERAQFLPDRYNAQTILKADVSESMDSLSFALEM